MASPFRVSGCTVAELGRDIDIDRQARETLEPVLGDQPGIECRAAGGDRQPIELGEIGGESAGKRTRPSPEIEVVRQRVPTTSGCSWISFAM